MLNILILIVDMALFLYFAKVGLNTADQTTRLICCVAMTYEVYLIIRFYKISKLKHKK